VTSFLIAILAQSVVCAVVASPFRSGTAAVITLVCGAVGTASAIALALLVA
jgi:hypothetical protein